MLYSLVNEICIFFQMLQIFISNIIHIALIQVFDDNKLNLTKKISIHCLILCFNHDRDNHDNHNLIFCCCHGNRDNRVHML